MLIFDHRLVFVDQPLLEAITGPLGSFFRLRSIKDSIPKKILLTRTIYQIHLFVLVIWVSINSSNSQDVLLSRYLSKLQRY